MIFDLDGVIRWLTFYRSEWTLQWESNVVNEVNDNMHYLLEAPPTEYYPVINELPELTILTHQPEDWKPLTELWIEKYLPQATTIYVENAEDKLRHLNGSILVEDNPTLPKEAYGRIVLVDRPYNQGVECYKRVFTPEELREVINDH